MSKQAISAINLTNAQMQAVDTVMHSTDADFVEAIHLLVLEGWNVASVQDAFNQGINP